MSKFVQAVVGVGLVVAGVVTGNFLLIGAGLQLTSGALLTPKAKGGDRAASAATLSIGEVPREGWFGQALNGGSLVDAFNYGGTNGTDWEVLVIALADHLCEALTGFYVNDTYVAFTGDGAVTGYNGQLVVSFRAGSETQAVPTILTANGPGWTANDNGAGVCYVVVAYKADTADAKNPVWPNGRPTFQWLLKGKRLYQARLDSSVGGSGAHRWADPTTWSWSDNPIDCHYNFVRGIYACDRVTDPGSLLVGRGLTTVEAPPANVFAPSAVCDEAVALDAGGSEKRYRANGVVKASETFLEIAEHFAAACAGVIHQPEGAVEIEPGQAKSPVFYFSDDDLIVGSTVKFTDDLDDSSTEWVNTVVPHYVEPSQRYADFAAPVRRVAADLTTDGGPREQTLTLALVTSGTQAGRVGEIARRLGRLWQRGTVTLGPRFAEIEEGDWGVWTSQRYLGGASVTFRVDAFASDEKWHHTLSLRQIATSVYSKDVDANSTAVATQQTVPSIGAPGAAAWTLAAGALAGSGDSVPVLIVTGATDNSFAELVRFEYLPSAGVADPSTATGWREDGTAGPDVKRREISVAPNTGYYVAVSYIVGRVPGPRRILGPATAGGVNAAWSNVTDPTGTKPADNATRNVVYRQSGAPASPANGDVWVVAASVPLFDFTGGSLPTGATLTRASTATDVNVAGTALTSFAANAPRIDSRGVLIEPAATNTLPNTSAFDSWYRDYSDIAPTVLPNNATAPDGTTTADTVTLPAVSGGGRSTLYQVVYGDTGNRAASVWLKGAAGGEVVYLMFYDTGQPTASSFLSVACTLTTSWQRFFLPRTLLSTYIVFLGVDLRVDTNQSAKPAQTFAAWGGQLEVGTKATSYTTDTRAADALSLAWGGLGVADGTPTVTYTFDDGSTQDVATVIASGAAAVPTNLNRARLRKAQIGTATGGGTTIIRFRVAGSWVDASNLVTGTGQLTDDALLGQTAMWPSIANPDGTKPANNATRNEVQANLIPSPILLDHSVAVGNASLETSTTGTVDHDRARAKFTSSSGTFYPEVNQELITVVPGETLYFKHSANFGTGSDGSIVVDLELFAPGGSSPVSTQRMTAPIMASDGVNAWRQTPVGQTVVPDGVGRARAAVKATGTAGTCWAGDFYLGRQQPGADVTAAAQVVVDQPTQAVVSCDYLGNPLSGELPRTIGTVVTRGGLSITSDASVTYAATFSNLTGTVGTGAGGTTKGSHSVTTLTANEGYLDVVVTVAGVAQPARRTVVTKQLAQRPVTGGSGSTYATDTTLNPITSTSAAQISDTLTVTVASGQKLYGSGSPDYYIDGVYSSGSQFRTATVYWAYRVAGSGGAFTAFAAGITGSQAKQSRYVGGDYTDPVPGSVNTAQNVTVSAGDYEVALFASMNATGPTMTWDTNGGAVMIEAKP